MPRVCKHCGSGEHTAFYCRDKPRTPIKRSTTPIKRTSIKRTAGKFNQQDREFKRRYLELHSPDEWGYYTCYLQTVPMCPIRLLPEQVTVEHRIPKGSIEGRKLRFNEENIGISCLFCNGDKGSIPLDEYLILVEERNNKRN